MKIALPKKSAVPDLYTMLTYRHAHNSSGEREFIKAFIMPLNPTIIADQSVPMAFIVKVGKSNVMFTSHTDTVHAKVIETRQQVILKEGLYQKNDNQPLGADDTAGVWLMINMIHAKVPGVYAFFRGEERGGIGSTYCATFRPELFEGIKCAIALDRRGTNSIITHQASGRGCSDEFGISLSNILGMGHTLDKTGIYTDTAEFFNIVPNCTNISVGYQNEHSKSETLDKKYVERLRDNLIAASWDALDHTLKRPDPPVQMYRSVAPMFNDFASYGATDIADFIHDNAHTLPRSLQEEALVLAQKIYKRFDR